MSGQPSSCVQARDGEGILRKALKVRTSVASPAKRHHVPVTLCRLQASSGLSAFVS